MRRSERLGKLLARKISEGEKVSYNEARANKR
jgi:hypothetical protein